MGHRMGEVRLCPACHHMHAVGTTCWQCAECRPGEVIATAAAPLAIVQCTLTPEQEAFNVGRAERIQAMHVGKPTETYFVPPGETLLSVTIRGQCAEEAASIMTGLARQLTIFERVPVPKPPDLGRRTDVRSTAHAHGHLAAYSSDPDDRILLLLTGRGPTFTLRGWLLAGDAKRPAWAHAKVARGRTEYWVPQGALHPLPLPEDA